MSQWTWHWNKHHIRCWSLACTASSITIPQPWKLLHLPGQPANPLNQYKIASQYEIALPLSHKMDYVHSLKFWSPERVLSIIIFFKGFLQNGMDAVSVHFQVLFVYQVEPSTNPLNFLFSINFTYPRQLYP
jgi:hypothetical protein